MLPSCTNSVSRRIDDQLFGKPIVSLPLYDKKIRTISADPAEDILLSYIQKRFEELLLPDSEVPKGDPREKLKSRLAQFTRLRQYVAPPPPCIWGLTCKTYRQCGLDWTTNHGRIDANSFYFF